MRILRSSALAAVGVMMVPGLSTGATPTGPGGASTAPPISSSVVSHGLKIALTVPAQAYPLDGLARTTITVQNVTRRVIQIVSSACTGQLTHTQVLDKRGNPFPWPVPFYPLPCPYTFPMKLGPGKSFKTTSIVYLRSGTLRADLTLYDDKAGDVDVTGKALRVATFAGQTEHATIAATPGSPGQLTSSIWPVPKNAGKLYYAAEEVCRSSSGAGNLEGDQPNTWQSTAASSLSTDIFGPSCVHEEWHFIAGWIGYRAARLDFSLSTT